MAIIKTRPDLNTRIFRRTGSSGSSSVLRDEKSQTSEFSLVRFTVDGEPSISHHVFPAPFKKVTDTLREFARLETNWDGQGSSAVSAETAKCAVMTLFDLAKRASEGGGELAVPAAAVSPDGAIGFEWTMPDVFIGVECMKSARSAYVRANEKETERVVRSSNDLWKVIGEYVSHRPAQAKA